MGASWDGRVSLIIFGVTVTLIFDLVLRIFVSRAYLVYYLSFESHICCLVASWDGGVSFTKYWVAVTSTYFLELSCQEHISYNI